ncbi:DUF4189 domain-containing protein [Rhizobium sp. SG2393]|uniref:DUF4189 domain-containing protein n=1 Tax=Rhizobium sp. SG2393 TaxID=3276279 RepID=UPI00366F726B
MQSVLRRSIFGLGFVLASLVSAHGALADSFGAISYSPDTGATGWSYSWSSRRQAEREAQQNCYENAGDCRVAIWFKNACGAVAAGDDGGWGSGWGSNSNRARREAIKQCSQYSDGCRVVRWQCSGAR